MISCLATSEKRHRRLSCHSNNLLTLVKFNDIVRLTSVPCQTFNNKPKTKH